MPKSVQVTRQKLTKGRYLVKIGETWYLETCTRGLQKRRTLGTSDLNEAMKLQASLPAGLDELPSAAAPTQPPPSPETLTLEDALEEYLDWYGEKNRQTSKERTEPVLRIFVGALGAEKDTRTIMREDIEKWIQIRRDGRSASTVRTDFNRIRAFLYWISDRKDAVERKVCRGISLPKTPRSPKPSPSAEKVRAVLRALGAGWIADYCRVLTETGMRPSELLGVRGTDLKGKLLAIKPHESRDLKTEASERTIVLNETAAEILTRRKEQMFKKEVPIFANHLGDVFKENSVYHIFKDTLAGGKLKKPPPELDMTLYDFRHFFCSEHAAPGPQHMDIETLGAYIGHSPASTQTLARFYIDQKALLRGAPATLIEQKDGEIVVLKRPGT